MSKDRCGNDSYTRIYWPGQDPLPMCPEHHAQVIQVAGTMGFHLHTDKARDGATCRAKVKEKE